MSSYHRKKNHLFQKLMLVALVIFIIPIAAKANIVDPQWLKSTLDHDALLIVDVRPEEDFLENHIKGSVHIEPMSLFADQLFLPPISEIQRILGGVGIDYQHKIVIVGNHEFIWAARLYWILEFLDHSDVYLLDTAWGHWDEDLLPISQNPIEPTPRNFVPRIDSSRITTQLGTLAAIDTLPILDGRSEAHFLGKDSGGASRAGHIPSAQHFPWTQNRELVEGTYRLKDLTALASVYEGLPKDEMIILYCTGSAQSAMNYVVLRELGYQVSVYEGSWTEWGNNLKLPIVNLSEDLQ